MKTIFLRSAYNYDVDEASVQSSLVCPEQTLAQQHMRDECDINTLVKRFARTGIPEGPATWPTDADFDEIFDFQSAMNVVVAGKLAFSKLPAAARDRFKNDPAVFLEYIGDSNNLLDAENLGLVPRGTYEKRFAEQKTREIEENFRKNQQKKVDETSPEA